MNLHATMIPYSGTVGGGLRLIDKDGRGRFMVAVIGLGFEATKEEIAAVASALIMGIPDGIEVPERKT